MNYKFLCATHSQELKSRPDRALASWANTNETGINLACMGQHNDAIPHLGCAFEIADIILSQNTIEPNKASAIFTKSTLSLAVSLNMMGYQDLKQSILLRAIERLNKVSNGTEYKSEQIELLTHSLSTPNVLH